jgi:hypothetical protein
LPDQCGDERALVPGRLAEELLQALTLLIVEVGDALCSLVAQVGDEASRVVLGVRALLGGGQGGDEGFQETLQTREHTAQHPRIDHRVREQLVQPDAKSSFHGKLLRKTLCLRRSFYETIYTRSSKTQ